LLLAALPRDARPAAAAGGLSVSHRLAFLWNWKLARQAEHMADYSTGMYRALKRELLSAGLGARRRPHAIAALAGGLVSAAGLKAIRDIASERDLLSRFEESYSQRLRAEETPGGPFCLAALGAELGQARQIYLEHIHGAGGALDGTDRLTAAIFWHLNSGLLREGEGDPYDGPLRSICDTAAARCAQAYQYFHFHLN
jgi:hypothetical protein